MKNSTHNRRNKPKPKENFDPDTLPKFELLETKRKSSICDSNDSTLNSPQSSRSASNSTSEADEVNFFDLDIEFPVESDLIKIDPTLPLIAQDISGDSSVFTVSCNPLSYQKVSNNKSSLKSYQSSHRSSPYCSSPNTFQSARSPAPAAVPYRGGRKKEAPPPMMTEEERRQWEKERLKKDNHNIIEKRRRYKINDCITEIGRLLPPIDMLNKKGTILQTAIEYIKKLQADESNRQELLMKLEHLEKTNKQLKDQLENQSVAIFNGNSFQFIPDNNPNRFDVSVDQSVKQEMTILKDPVTLFQNELANGHLDFSNGLSVHQQDLLCDDFIFMKHENKDNEMHLLGNFDHNMNHDPGAFACDEGFGSDPNFLAAEKSSSDLHALSTFGTPPPGSLLSLPHSESLGHSAIGMGNTENVTFFSNVFLEHGDSTAFPNISDIGLPMDGTLYSLAHDFIMRDEDLVSMN